MKGIQASLSDRQCLALLQVLHIRGSISTSPLCRRRLVGLRADFPASTDVYRPIAGKQGGIEEISAGKIPRNMQGGSFAGIAGIRVFARLGNVETPFLQCPEQWSPIADLIPDVHIFSALEYESNDVKTPFLQRPNEWCPATSVPGIRIGVEFEKEFCNLEASFL
ncbi:hypothetical protein BGW80DRAFT_1567904 [Lactifluus volemus]|nr:hypothetical protein BGW80DRAFT_1567904 [Lactifluus volemus]